MRARTQKHTDDFAFTVRMHTEIQHFGSFRSFCEVVFGIASNGIDVKTLHHGRAARAILIKKMINGAGVAFFPNVGINEAFTDELLIGNFGDHELARREEANDVVDFGAIANRFVLFEAITNEAFFVIDV